MQEAKERIEHWNAQMEENNNSNASKPKTPDVMVGERNDNFLSNSHNEENTEGQAASKEEVAKTQQNNETKPENAQSGQSTQPNKGKPHQKTHNPDQLQQEKNATQRTHPHFRNNHEKEA